MDTKIKNKMNSSQILNQVKSEEGQQQIISAIKNENKIQKVYLAILNSGTLRREIMSVVIPAMKRTKNVKLVWENPNKTWANPISSNRNQIVKRFLATDCDFLLMIDDDVVPLHNPCELVYANQDIIGSPALVRAPGNILTWVAYIPHSKGVGYSAVDLNSFDDMFDILEVATVGTGCILIKRRVLETLKAPFHSEFDEDGIQTHGTDFAFCRKATKAGFKVYTTTHRRCEHYKNMGLNEMDTYDSINYFDRSNIIYNTPWGENRVSQKDWHFMKAIIEDVKPKRILEFGSGLSSLLMSEICEVISYETSEQWKKDVEAKCTDKNNLIVRLWNGIDFSDSDCSPIPEKFDLVFVDGPKGKLTGGIGRDTAINIASKVSDHIILHDAGRCEEEQYQRKYLRSIFRLTRRSGNHIARCNYWIRRPKPVTLDDVKKQLNNRK